jgi:hypothetical protein
LYLVLPNGFLANAYICLLFGTVDWRFCKKATTCLQKNVYSVAMC